MPLKSKIVRFLTHVLDNKIIKKRKMYYVCELRDQEYLYIYIHIYYQILPYLYHWPLAFGKEIVIMLRDPVINLNLITAAERVSK